MPYKLIKLKNNKYRVINSETGEVKAFQTTKDNAIKQIRLLYALERNPSFRRKFKKSSKRSKRSYLRKNSGKRSSGKRKNSGKRSGGRKNIKKRSYSRKRSGKRSYLRKKSGKRSGGRKQ